MVSVAPAPPVPAGALPPLPERRPSLRKRLRETVTAYAYLFPAASILILFHIVPIFYAFYISLFRWRLVQGPFVGLDNYVDALNSPDFWQSLTVTLYFAAGTIPLTLGLAFIIAYALFRKVRSPGLYRMIYFMPYITSAVAAALVWRWIFHAQYGILNSFLGLFGIPAQTWLLEPSGIFELLAAPFGVTLPGWAGGPSLALVSIIIYTVWHSVGFAVVIMMAGLTNISPELYDAAKVDGANEWQLLRHITLPMLSPTLFFLSIVSVINAFQTFNSIYVMTDPNHGGPLGTTRNVTMLIYVTFYEFTRPGAASAIAFLLFFIILALTVLQVRVLGRRVTYGN